MPLPSSPSQLVISTISRRDIHSRVMAPVQGLTAFSGLGEESAALPPSQKWKRQSQFLASSCNLDQPLFLSSRYHPGITGLWGPVISQNMHSTQTLCGAPFSQGCLFLKTGLMSLSTPLQDSSSLSMSWMTPVVPYLISFFPSTTGRDSSSSCLLHPGPWQQGWAGEEGSNCTCSNGCCHAA